MKFQLTVNSVCNLVQVLQFKVKFALPTVAMLQKYHSKGPTILLLRGGLGDLLWAVNFFLTPSLTMNFFSWGLCLHDIFSGSFLLHEMFFR